MSRAGVRVVVGLAFLGALVLSISPEDAEIVVEAASAEDSSCGLRCDQGYKLCVDVATERAKVSSCYRCCKETEASGQVGFNTDPTHEELEEGMFTKCVTTLESALHPEWYSEGFPRSYKAAVAYTPKTGALAREIARKYGASGDGSGDPAITRADESACIKGCSHRPQAAMKGCTLLYGACRRACPSGASCKGR